MKSLGLTATFHFPKVDNVGVGLTMEMNIFRGELIRKFGGYSEKFNIHGYWMDDKTGKGYDEHHTAISVSSPDLTMDEIKRLAGMIKKLASQIAVYVKIDGKAFLA